MIRCAWLLALVACGDSVPPLATAQPGVIFTYPIDGEVDVPTGARIVVTFSDDVADAAGVQLVGPAGPIAATAQVVGDGRSVQLASAPLDPGATYGVVVPQSVMPAANNLPASGPLLSFTTRSDRPRAAAPTLIAVDGGKPTQPDSFRPLFETSTIRLVFSEPLDPRSVTMGPGAIELTGPGGAVPATLVAGGI